ncbi:MAG: DNA polymerase III subunit chi [Rhodobacteraceae bacterium]|nr:DNA polymerase III subunit chi [Paracoccaceae bacterium]
MGAALFYHITRSPTEEVVASLLSRAVAQGWRVELRGVTPEYLDMLDQRLWLGAEEGFLPHGRAGGPHDALQPVLIGTGPGPAANDPQALMTVQSAPLTPDEIAARERVWILFDGNDPAALEAARAQWRGLTAAGVAAQYWSEESGRWEKKAENQAATV